MELVSDKKIKRANQLLKGVIKNQKYQEDPLYWYTDRWKGPAEDLDWTQADREKYKKHTWDGTVNPFISPTTAK